MIKRLIAISLLIVLTVYIYPTFSADIERTAYVRFLDNGSCEADGITAKQENYSTGCCQVRTDANGVSRPCWILGVNSTQNRGIALDVTKIRDLHNRENYRLDITYLDVGLGYFAITYSGADGQQFAGRIMMEDTNVWVTKSMILEACAFSGDAAKNRVDDCDIFLTTYLMLDAETSYGYSVGEVPISQIELYDTSAISTAAVVCNTTGEKSVFFGNVTPVMNIGVKDTYGNGGEVALEFQVIDESGNSVWFKNVKTNIEREAYKYLNIALDEFNRYGVFDFKVTVCGGGKYTSKVFSFSVIKTDFGQKRNESIGVNSHFSWHESSSTLMPYMKNAGLTFFRDGIKWREYESAQGEYKLSEQCAAYLDNAEEYGLEPLIVLGGGNALYMPGDSANDFPKTEAELSGFSDYVYNLVAELKGRVKYYEVWNEFDHVENGTAADYVKILKAAYDAAKRADPQVKIIGMAGGRKESFYKDVGENGGYEYMDIFSFHNYPDTVPENGELLSGIKKLIHSYAGDIEIWETEYGYAENSADTDDKTAPNWTPKGLTEKMQAAYLVRMWLYNRANGFWDKIFWYDLENDGVGSYYLENNFGMVRSDHSAKSAYAALSCMNTLLYDVKSAVSYMQGDNMIYTLTSSTDQKTYAAVNTKNNSDTVEITVDAAEGIVYDMYGNSRTVRVENGKIVLQTDGAPIYFKAFPCVEARADYDGETVTVTADFDGKFGLSESLLLVMNDGYTIDNLTAENTADALVYLAQKQIDESGHIAYVFPLLKEGSYNVCISAGDAAQSKSFCRCRLEIKPGISASVILVSDGENEIESINRLYESDLEKVTFSSTLINPRETDATLKLIVAGYKENRLIWVEKVMTESLKRSEFPIEIYPVIDDKQKADVMKSFLWNVTRGGITPVSDKKILD